MPENESPAGPAGPVVLRLASGVSPDPRRQTPDENNRPPGFPGGLPFVGVGPLRAAALQEQREAREGESRSAGLWNGCPTAAGRNGSRRASTVAVVKRDATHHVGGLCRRNEIAPAARPPGAGARSRGLSNPVPGQTRFKWG